jgi:hypothetical protein
MFVFVVFTSVFSIFFISGPFAVVVTVVVSVTRTAVVVAMTVGEGTVGVVWLVIWCMVVKVGNGNDIITDYNHVTCTVLVLMVWLVTMLMVATAMTVTMTVTVVWATLVVARVGGGAHVVVFNVATAFELAAMCVVTFGVFEVESMFKFF